MDEVLKQAAVLKHREVISDTVSEFQRRGNFVRIYPAKSSYKYDQYFMGARPLNKLVYKALYSDKALIPMTLHNLSGQLRLSATQTIP